MNTEPVLRPVDEVHIGGVQRLGELYQPLRLHLRVLQPVDDADRATDAQILQKEHFLKNIYCKVKVVKNINLFQVQLVLATVLGEVLLEERVPELVGVDVDVAGLEPAATNQR